MFKIYPVKTYFLSAFLCAICSTISFAQVGIGNTNPKTTLDVSGALSLREGTALTFVNGSNIDIDLGTTPYSTYRITGPTAAFEIGSIIPETNADGQLVTFINTTNQDMTIIHFAGGARRIYCPDETNVVLTGRYASVTFQYNAILTKWMLIHSMGGSGIKDWSPSGNAGTTPGVDFLGTTDNVAMSFFTNNTEKLRISQNGHFRSFTDGSATLPMFSWDTDRDTGFFRIGNDTLGFTTGGIEKFRLGTTEAVFNDTGVDVNFRVATNNNPNALFVDGGTDRVGIKTNSPLTSLHIAGASSVVRIESLNSTNDTNNNGLDPAVVMVNNNGDLFLRPSVDDLPIDANDAGTGSEAFMASPIVLSSVDGSLALALGYTVDITLTRTTLVEVAFWTAVNISNYNGTLTLDNMPRLYGGLVQTGTGTDIVYSASSYTNAASLGTITTGMFTVGGNGFVTLPPGTHTIQLLIFTSGGETDGTNPAEGVQTIFGANGFNRFQIVYHN